MAASNQQIADAARDSLARILVTDTSGWTEGARQQQMTDIKALRDTITEFDAKAARSAGRRIFVPVTPVGG